LELRNFIEALRHGNTDLDLKQ
jgi:hypothetical protein